MSITGWENLDRDDDLSAMERSCFKAFIGPEQAGTLLESWARQEIPDNEAFLREFAPSMLLPEPNAIRYDDDPYVEEGEGDEPLPLDYPEILD